MSYEEGKFFCGLLGGEQRPGGAEEGQRPGWTRSRGRTDASVSLLVSSAASSASSRADPGHPARSPSWMGSLLSLSRATGWLAQEASSSQAAFPDVWQEGCSGVTMGTRPRPAWLESGSPHPWHVGRVDTALPPPLCLAEQVWQPCHCLALTTPLGSFPG